jgi:hypothetical protein
MSNCYRCKTELNSENCYKKNQKLQSYCKKCFLFYCKDRWTKRKIDIINSFGNFCFDCKQSFDYCVYDFHHLDPTEKKMDWRKMRLVSIEKLQEELKKCIMLCANCHRIRHHDKSLSQNQPIVNSKINKIIKNRKTKINWPSNDELSDLVQRYPCTKVAKMLGVSDKAIEKRCKKFKIEKPKRGHWEKIYHSKN